MVRQHGETLYGETLYGETLYGETLYGKTLYGETSYGETLYVTWHHKTGDVYKIMKIGFISLLGRATFFEHVGVCFILFEHVGVCFILLA